MALAEHLRAGAAAPFVWGVSDCCLFACDWVLARRGVDPMASWRGHYRTRLGAYRRVQKGGGWLATVSLEMTAAGLAPTDTPQPGDIALVMTEQGEALAIRTPTGWACKSPRGVVVASFPVLAAWTV